MKRNLVLGAVALALAGTVWWTVLRGPTDAGHHIAADGALPRAMTTTHMAGIAQGAPIVAPVLPDALSPQAQMGRQAFSAKCAACHGENAAGIKGNGPPLVHKIYEPGHHADFAFMRAAQQGVRAHHWPFGDMPPVSGLTQGEIKTIIAYIRSLQQANGIM